MKLNVNGAIIESLDPVSACQCAISMLGYLDDKHKLIAADLETVKKWGLAEITRQRGEARRPYLIDTFGQELVYADKEQQARVWLSIREPNPKDYPLLYGRQAEFLGLTPEKMATIILEKAQEWHIASDQIDAAALEAATETEQATTSGAIAEILIGFCEVIYDLALDSAK